MKKRLSFLQDPDAWSFLPHLGLKLSVPSVVYRLPNVLGLYTLSGIIGKIQVLEGGDGPTILEKI